MFNFLNSGLYSSYVTTCETFFLQIHHPWPLSPLKKKEKPHTSFLDLPLPEDDEDDDDDEYNPDKEIEVKLLIL